ncbi:hypothetical protein PG999_012223 [Apiospora kogelbergensis]|uniref:Uncharacterized protein n=1 Tax=Apiospora kogelbergensis TaxID=1337665 RepID=A0AAW0QQC0_9PEZI
MESHDSHDALSASTEMAEPINDSALDLFPPTEDMALADVSPLPDLGYLAQTATGPGSTGIVDPKQFVGLSEINNKLQSCNSRIQGLATPLELHHFKHNESPLVLDKNVTLAESLLILGQSFLDNLIELKGVPVSPQQAPIGRLESATALLVVSIYVQLASMFDLMFSVVMSEMYAGAGRGDATAATAHALRLGAFASKDGTMQALVYTQMVIRLLAQIDRHLGLASSDQLPSLVRVNEPLLSPRHMELLQAELNEDQCVGGSGKRQRLNQSMDMARKSLEACDQ